MVSIRSHLAHLARIFHSFRQPDGVAQTSPGLPGYRGFPIRRRDRARTTCRLEVGDTAGWKLALRSLGRPVTPIAYELSGLGLAVLCLGAPLVQGADAAKLEGLYGQWLAVQTNLQSWSADFTQTRSLKVLAEPLVATGRVWVAASRFRWEWANPRRPSSCANPTK